MHREPSAPDAPLDACAVLDGTAAMAEEKQHIEQFNVDAPVLHRLSANRRSLVYLLNLAFPVARPD